MTNLFMTLIASMALMSPYANASPSCSLKKALEQGVRENLSNHVALSEITKVTKQSDGSYFVEFVYVGNDYEDAGYFVFQVDERSCVAKRK